MKSILRPLVCTLMLGACVPSVSSESDHAEPVQAGQADEDMTGYKEKSDILRLRAALQQTELSNAPQKETEWNRRLTQARNQEDIKVIMGEQLALNREVEAALQPLKMNSEKGRQVHAQMLRGYSGVRQVLEKLINVDMDTPEGSAQVEALNQQLTQHVVDVMESMKAWMAMQEANGWEYDDQAKVQIQQKMEELERKVNQ